METARLTITVADALNNLYRPEIAGRGINSLCLNFHRRSRAIAVGSKAVRETLEIMEPTAEVVIWLQSDVYQTAKAYQKLDQNKPLTVKDVSLLLGVNASRVRALIKSGRLAADKVGRDWLIDVNAVEAVMNRKPGRPSKV